MKNFCWSVLMSILATTVNCSAQTSDHDIWNREQLFETPEMEWLDSTSPIRSLTYVGENHNDAATDVFAFYATPGTISGDTSKDQHLPAVVLIHGGGGTAFAEWAWLWAQRGYAAIAMDLSGRRPDAPQFRDGQLIPNHAVKRSRLQRGGLEQGHAEKFGSVGGTVSDDWPYHAVASVMRAHSLIRSFPEVDADRTAVTGISWGGYTTCLVASVDSRFQAAVPVYGCGFLYDGESVQRSAIDALPENRRQEWIRRYDPSSHLSHCRVPILFVNGTNDKHYPLISYSRSFGLVPADKQIRIEVNMRHSHIAGWEPKEIGLFVDHYLKNTPGLPHLDTPEMQDNIAIVRYQAPVELKSAALNYTTDTGPLVDRKWHTVAAKFNAQTIRTPPLPDDTTVWMITATDQRDAMTSTDVVFTE